MEVVEAGISVRSGYLQPGFESARVVRDALKEDHEEVLDSRILSGEAVQQALEESGAFSYMPQNQSQEFVGGVSVSIESGNSGIFRSEFRHATKWGAQRDFFVPYIDKDEIVLIDLDLEAVGLVGPDNLEDVDPCARAVYEAATEHICSWYGIPTQRIPPEAVAHVQGNGMNGTYGIRIDDSAWDSLEDLREDNLNQQIYRSSVREIYRLGANPHISPDDKRERINLNRVGSNGDVWYLLWGHDRDEEEIIVEDVQPYQKAYPNDNRY